MNGGVGTLSRWWWREGPGAGSGTQPEGRLEHRSRWRRMLVGKGEGISAQNLPCQAQLHLATKGACAGVRSLSVCDELMSTRCSRALW